MAEPAWNTVLRALRETCGLSQEGWAARLGYGRRTLQRWEHGEVIPDAAAEAALVALCTALGLLHRYDRGALAGLALAPEWLHELLAGARLNAAAGGQVSSPTAEAAVLVSLPAPLTSFLGRETELAALAQLLDSARLVTLTGAGGTGKTRLALCAAARRTGTVPDGVFFVDLAPLQDPTLVPAAVAHALGVQGYAETQPRASVLRFLREKRLLLVLDNYEHLLAAAEFAAAMLQEAPGARLLVTSRAPLRIPGERELAVSPLPLPAAAQDEIAALAQNPSVALFVARAQDVRSDFCLTVENAPAVAAICRRLDGLPLAIELAAARVRALPPAALLARLEHRLPLLTRGARTAPARQQTLRDTIAWSDALLEPAEQRLFRRLAVFAGGCTLTLAEGVCNADGNLGLEVLDGVSSLVEKSLLWQTDDQAGEPRYRMLETIREFALGELEAGDDADSLREQLALQILRLARRCAVTFDWARLDSELDNTRAVLSWCVARSELELGVRLFWALRWYFRNRGYGAEQEAWRQRLLAMPDAAVPSISRARLLTQGPRELFSFTERERAGAELEEGIALSRQLGDTPGLVDALPRRAVLCMEQGQQQAMRPLAEEALALCRNAGDAAGSALMQFFLIVEALDRNDAAAAERLLAENRVLEGTTRSVVGLHNEALLAEANGDLTQARRLLEEIGRRAVVETGEHSPFRLQQLAQLARILLRQGDMRAAAEVCATSLAVQQRVGPSRFLPLALNVLAQAAERGGLHTASAHLLAAVARQRSQFAAEVPGLKQEQQQAVGRVRRAMSEAAFAEVWVAGEALTTNDAIRLGLAVAEQLRGGPTAS